MPTLPKRVADRMRAAIKTFAPILVAQRDRDVSEADTVTLVKDLLSELFGYDKYAEVTSEHAIRGTYCDLAIKIEGKLRLLIEVKAIGLTLTQRHIKQAVDYAANQGIDWIVLTNGVNWLMFQVVFGKPIDAKEIAQFDLLALEAKKDEELERPFLLTREGFLRGAIAEFAEKQQAMSRYMLAALLVNDDDVANVIRRELRRVTDLLVPVEAIQKVLRQEVIKREALEGDEAVAAMKAIVKSDRAPRAKRRTDADSDACIENDQPSPAAEAP